MLFALKYRASLKHSLRVQLCNDKHSNRNKRNVHKTVKIMHMRNNFNNIPSL
jgi:hypothetical protein